MKMHPVCCSLPPETFCFCLAGLLHLSLAAFTLTQVVHVRVICVILATSYQHTEANGTSNRLSTS